MKVVCVISREIVTYALFSLYFISPPAAADDDDDFDVNNITPLQVRHS